MDISTPSRFEGKTWKFPICFICAATPGLPLNIDAELFPIGCFRDQFFHLAEPTSDPIPCNKIFPFWSPEFRL
jgi:hypothetical protein